jgi:hypothetical protein
LPEARPFQFGLPDIGFADLVVAPWSEEISGVSKTAHPRVWVELKTRATWWEGGPAKAFGAANGGLVSDIEKWRSLDSAGDAVLISHITSHDGPWGEPLPKTWREELERVGAPFTPAMPALEIAFEIPGKDQPRYRWTRMDCLLVHGG